MRRAASSAPRLSTAWRSSGPGEHGRTSATSSTGCGALLPLSQRTPSCNASSDGAVFAVHSNGTFQLVDSVIGKTVLRDDANVVVHQCSGMFPERGGRLLNGEARAASCAQSFRGPVHWRSP